MSPCELLVHLSIHPLQAQSRAKYAWSHTRVLAKSRARYCSASCAVYFVYSACHERVCTCAAREGFCVLYRTSGSAVLPLYLSV